MSESPNTGLPKRGKTNGYNSNKLHAKRDRKSFEADGRNLLHIALPLSEKIAKVQSRGGSKRELARLLALQKEFGHVESEPVKKESKKVTKKKA